MILTALQQVVREHGLWAAIIGVHMSAGLLATLAGPVPVVDSRLLTALSGNYFLLLLATSLYAPLLLFARHRLRVRDHRGQRISGLLGWRLALKRFREDVAPERIVSAIVAAALVVLTFAVHDAWKRAIGQLEPYTWDQVFSSLDRAIHGGKDPWLWLDAWLGEPTRTILLDRIYFLWYALLAIGFGWQSWNPNRVQRTRFYVAMALTWLLLGTLVAHACASGGPVFYSGLAAGPDPYVALRHYLGQVNQHDQLYAVQLQLLVWDNFIRGGHALWISMSAMPSLHVAEVTLLAIAAWGESRIVGTFLWAGTLITLIGSVYLGWHYAVDGYVAILGTAVAWRLAQWAA